MNLSRIASFNNDTGPHVGMLAIVGIIFVICMLAMPIKDRSDWAALQRS